MNKILREPSSWAGLAAILQGVAMLAPQYAAVINGVSMLFGGLAVAVREKGGQ